MACTRCDTRRRRLGMLLLLAGAEAVRMPHGAMRTPPPRAASPQMTTDDESFIQRTLQAGDAVESKAVSAEVVTSVTPLSPSQPTLAAATRAPAATMAIPFLGANGPDEEELKAIFYQADTDLSGEIDREELSSALFTIGYRIKVEDYNAMFDEVDDDKSGRITFEEFKEFISKTEQKTFKSQRFAMDLFRKFDIDEGGTIDKFEFAALAQEVEANYKRRTLLTAAAAAVGAVVVAQYTQEFAFAQKTFRSFYIEKQAEAAQRRCFPTAKRTLAA